MKKLEHSDVEGALIRWVGLDTAHAKMVIHDIPHRPGMAAELFCALAQAEVAVDMIVQSVTRLGESTLTFTLLEADRRKAFAIMKRVFVELGADEVTTHGPIAKISVVGSNSKKKSSIATKVFQVLAAAAIDIEMISASDLNVSVVVGMEYAERAFHAICSVLEINAKFREGHCAMSPGLRAIVAAGRSACTSPGIRVD